MNLRPLTSQNLNNYPKIQIDRGSVIRPCNVDQTAADQFIDTTNSGWKRVLKDAWYEGMPHILQWIISLKIPTGTRRHMIYLIKTSRYLAMIFLFIHRIYMYVYGYFFPYSFMPIDRICDEFSKCSKWSEAVIRAFAWHPNYDRCALAICNDYVYVYQGSQKIRVLRHAQQRKITDLAWKPDDKEILIVATQTSIIIWRISDNYSTSNLSREINPNRGAAYLSPALQLVMRGNDTTQSSSSPIRSDSTTNTTSKATQDTSASTQSRQSSDFRIINRPLPAPIISMQFDSSGSRLYTCSPNSSRIAILSLDHFLNKNNVPESNLTKELDKRKPIDYLTRFGQGFVKLLWSPEKNRLAAVTTTHSVCVFEPFSWTSSKWSLKGQPMQDIIWSRPHGRMLLMANKIEPKLYALPFLDSPQPYDVGGNKSLMEALNLTATGTEDGDIVGGPVSSLAWDKEGKRLAISFRDNSESILLYRTVEKPTVEFHQLGVIQSETGSFPLIMQFHDKFKGGSLLTVCWSDGICQHIPLYHTPNENTKNGSSGNDSFNRSLMNSSFNNSFNEPKSPAKTPRSLTNFCHVAGNNSISAHSPSLVPVNKVQYHTNLFSLSSRCPVDVSRDSLEDTAN